MPEILVKEQLKRPQPAQLARVAAFHWLTTASVGTLVLVALVRILVRTKGRYAVQDAGFEYDSIIQVNGIVGIVAAIVLAASARALARSIGLDRWFNVFVLLKESMEYFREKGVDFGFFGRSLPHINRVAKARDEGGRQQRDAADDAQGGTGTAS